jgi:hypothetical protein
MRPGRSWGVPLARAVQVLLAYVLPSQDAFQAEEQAGLRERVEQHGATQAVIAQKAPTSVSA